MKRKIIISLIMIGICLLIFEFVHGFIRNKKRYPELNDDAIMKLKDIDHYIGYIVQEYEKEGYQLVSLEEIDLDTCDDMIKNDDVSKDYQYSFYAMDVEGHIKEDRKIEINNKEIGYKMKTRIRDEYVIYIITEENYLYFVNDNKLISNSKISSILSSNKDGIEYYIVLFEDESKYEFTLD